MSNDLQPSGEIIQINPAQLSPHPVLRSQPWMPEADFRSLRESVKEHGVIQPILITPEHEVVDGRHRWKAACGEKLAAVPCQVVAATQGATIALTTILDRRHYGKGARAFLSLPLIAQAAEEGKAKRAANLKNNKTGKKAPETVLSGISANDDTEELAERLGIGLELLRLARHTEQLFQASDKRVQEWLAAFEEEAALWQAWQDEHPTQELSWACWRTARLGDMGHNVQDPKVVNIIPEDLRETYTFELFNGDMGLGSINKAVGSILATKGGPRPDQDPNNPALTITLGRKLQSFSSSMFHKDGWEKLDAVERVQLAKSIASTAATWPDEVCRALVAELGKKGGK